MNGVYKNNIKNIFSNKKKSQILRSYNSFAKKSHEAALLYLTGYSHITFAPESDTLKIFERLFVMYNVYTT